jgi:dihydrofolate reductase
MLILSSSDRISVQHLNYFIMKKRSEKMTNERKVILYIAASVDGYIARENGEIDWLEEAGSKGEGDSGYGEFYNTIDTVLLGRKTYDHVLVLANEFPYKDKTCYVFSNEQNQEAEHVQFINEDAAAFTKKLKAETGGDIWLVGGAGLLDTFIKEKLVDEFIITVIPIILGKGIPLFKSNNPECELKLKETRRYGEFVQMHYSLNASSKH